jgi:hypothetical protein
MPLPRAVIAGPLRLALVAPLALPLLLLLPSPRPPLLVRQLVPRLLARRQYPPWQSPPQALTRPRLLRPRCPPARLLLPPPQMWLCHLPQLHLLNRLQALPPQALLLLSSG